MKRVVILTATLVLAACSTPPSPVTTAPRPVVTGPQLIPAPSSLTLKSEAPFDLNRATSIVVDGTNAEVTAIAQAFATMLRPSTGFPLVVTTSIPDSVGGHIRMWISGSRPHLGEEGYELNITRHAVTLAANRPAGLFRGIQTLRQMLPAEVESDMGVARAEWPLPALAIVDQPRYAWRGAMLDVSRHFFTVSEVKQYIDLLALYKLNTLHLHLADDQGWRIEIKSRPNLTTLGSVTQVGGGPGGFYTQADYADIVQYAQDRYITIVPEIDMPGHTNAALISNQDLSCSRRSPALYTGTDVGWSTLCANKEETYAFVDDVMRELAAITPGKYLHMGGDENPILSREEYTKFVERTQDIVTKHGKQMVGWEEISHARLAPTTISQAWASDTTAAAAVKYGAKVLMSPSKRTYFDMKYDDATELGLKWAALIEVRDAYDWDPATYMKGVTEQNIIGVEAPMWAETVRNITAVQYLAFPRLPALAEVGWTPQASRSWDSFRMRIATHAPRWNLLGVNYYRSPQIPW